VRPDALLGQAGIPHAEGRWTQEGGAFVRMNAAGFRDRERKLEKPPGRLRIAVLGDSYVEARQVELEDTFASVAERTLGACPALAGATPELLNFGFEGYGTAQELLLLRRQVFAYAPDWVVLAFFVGNDLKNNSKALQQGGRPYFVYQDGALVLDDGFNDSLGQRLRTGPLGRGFYALLPHSRVLQLAFHASEQRRRADKLAQIAKTERLSPGNLVPGDEPGLDSQVYREPADPDWQLAWRVTEDLLRKLRDEVQRRGARFLLVAVGTGIQVHPEKSQRERFAAVIGVPDLDYPDRRLRAFAEREHIELLALVPPLRELAEDTGECLHGKGQSGTCHGHWNALGHRAVGEALALRLCALVDGNARRRTPVRRRAARRSRAKAGSPSTSG
jgi:hypothetical protein